MKAAPPDDLYRCKGIVPFAAEEAADETARLGLPPPEASAATKLGDSWWLFNGVAGRLTLEPLRNCAGPASIVFMGRDLRLRAPAIEAALRLPPGSVGDARAPKPAFGPGDGLLEPSWRQRRFAWARRQREGPSIENAVAECQ